VMDGTKRSIQVKKATTPRREVAMISLRPILRRPSVGEQGNDTLHGGGAGTDQLLGGIDIA
jgi:hypothetical protein